MTSERYAITPTGVGPTGTYFIKKRSLNYSRGMKRRITKDVLAKASDVKANIIGGNQEPTKRFH